MTLYTQKEIANILSVSQKTVMNWGIGYYWRGKSKVPFYDDWRSLPVIEGTGSRSNPRKYKLNDVKEYLYGIKMRKFLK